MCRIDATHDPGLSSWVTHSAANECDFPIQNLPYGVFRRQGTNESFRCGVAIGDQILDLRALHSLNLLAGKSAKALEACSGGALNPLMKLSPDYWSALRQSLTGSGALVSDDR